MIAIKSWIKNDQVSKNMEQLINAKYTQEEG